MGRPDGLEALWGRPGVGRAAAKAETGEKGTRGGVRSASLSLCSLGPSQPHLEVQAGASQRPCTPVSLGFCRRIHTLRNKTRPGRGARSVPQKKAELGLSVPSSAEGLRLALCG